ncbi:hypothetical protein [uncultured Kordia sp.]|uniref:hypothetical protein n=1 Tax=uncultured Kordia sp. TaxID=507699 RepID=UPI002610172C|nr:hypothetical protein [uncultured Kordia sp.]
MITEKQRKELKKALGYHYTDDVLKILKKRGVTNKKGAPYGRSMIRNVYNGLNGNKEIENAIMELFITKQEEKERQLKARNRILGISVETDN